MYAVVGLDPVLRKYELHKVWSPTFNQGINIGAKFSTLRGLSANLRSSLLNFRNFETKLESNYCIRNGGPVKGLFFIASNFLRFDEFNIEYLRQDHLKYMYLYNS
jgi:hypothetical protein